MFASFRRRLNHGLKYSRCSRVSPKLELASSPAANPAEARVLATRRGFTLVELLVVIAIIGILVALLLPAIQAAREAARRSQCTTNIKNIALALQNYHDIHKEFPPAITLRDISDPILNDNRLYKPSWAHLVLPHLEEQALFDTFDFTVKLTDATVGSRNYNARGTELPIMLCPSDNGRNNRFVDSGGNWARGNYGYNAFEFWPNQFLWPTFSTDPKLRPLYKVNMGMGGFMLADGTQKQTLSLAKIIDGASHTIALAEMRVGLSPRDRRGVWAMGMCGSNFHCRHAATGINSCNGYDDDLFGDANVQADVGDGALQMECMRPDVGVNASGQSTVRSRHPGGAHVAMADGSVHFLTDFIDTGNMPISSYINEGTKQWEDPNLFRTWQRLLISGDGYAIETSF
jgi:prepilin-type N-terminal cleavage/methylation domain-containing protein/prepilin-type processing-associated H-X9-DG protein